MKENGSSLLQNVRVYCAGHEESLSECYHIEEYHCKTRAAVLCTGKYNNVQPENFAGENFVHHFTMHNMGWGT